MRGAQRFGFAGLALTCAFTTGTLSADVVAVVAANSPVASLSKTQLIDIFLGKTTRYPDGRRAVPIDQIEGAPARDEFYATFAAMTPAQVKSFWSRMIFTGRGELPKSVASAAEVTRLLLEDSNAIAYVDRNTVDPGLRVVLIP